MALGIALATAVAPEIASRVRLVEVSAQNGSDRRVSIREQSAIYRHDIGLALEIRAKVRSPETVRRGIIGPPYVRIAPNPLQLSVPYRRESRRDVTRDHEYGCAGRQL